MSTDNWHMIILECPRCKFRCYSWCEEDALEKYNQHKCKMTTKQIDKILSRILDEIPVGEL